jgi:hypothetical protein
MRLGAFKRTPVDDCRSISKDDIKLFVRTQPVILDFGYPAVSEGR